MSDDEQTTMDDEANISEEMAARESEQYLAQLEEAIGSTTSIGEAGGIAMVDVWGVARGADKVPHVVKIMLTSRAQTPLGALQNLAKAIGYAKTKMKMNPWIPEFSAPTREPVAERPPVDQSKVGSGQPAAAAPAHPPLPPIGTPPPPANRPAPVAPSAPAAAPRPAPAATGGETTEVIDITKIKHVIDTNGNEKLTVMGGKWAKFGVTAFTEMADTISTDWKSWPVGQEYGPLPGFEKAEVLVDTDAAGKQKPRKVVRFFSK